MAVGRAPLAGDAIVRLDPNRLFGRHLAVLGNTGSGKSCTVAQLVRTSAMSVGTEGAFRAIVLDLNGEYRSAFDDLPSGIRVRRFSVFPGDGDEQLRVPSWIWNYREWLSFTDASAKSQAPQLRRALHLLRTVDVAGCGSGVVALIAGRRVVRQYQASAIESKNNGDALSLLENVIAACDVIAVDAPVELKATVSALRLGVDGVLSSRRGSGQYVWKYSTPLLNLPECSTLLPLFNDAIEANGVPEFLGDGFTVDTPHPFNAVDLLELLPLLAAEAGNDVVGWVAPLVDRLRIALADDRLTAISGWDPSDDLGSWIKGFLSDDRDSQITVLDLSLVPSNVLHLVCGVFARVILEALERHRRQDPTNQIPVVLVVEEAHALIRRHFGGSDEDQTVPMARLCREAFERIAREGRKFGLSLVVSSQRPSELSETVLSQCNTFLVHRIVNDHDQSLVRRLLPDSLGALVQELPALPSQTALLVGWAIDVPTLVRIDDLAAAYRPQSADPDFAAAWQGTAHGRADWEALATGWSARATTSESDPGEGPTNPDSSLGE